MPVSAAAASAPLFVTGAGVRPPAPAVPPPAGALRPALDRPSAPVVPLGPDIAPSPREVARALAARPTLWRPLVRYRDPRYHVRLTSGAGWEAWLLTWLPGQSTGLHDHGGSAGAFAVVAGSVDESLPLRGVVTEGEPARLISRRYRTGQVRAFGSQHLHDVAARDGSAAVTLHVYAPRLTTMTRYALVDGRLEVTAREEEGADW